MSAPAFKPMYFAEFRGFIVTANADNTIPLNAKIVAELLDFGQNMVRDEMITRANLASYLYEALHLMLTPDRKSVYATPEVINRAAAAIARAEGKS